MWKHSKLLIWFFLMALFSITVTPPVLGQAQIPVLRLPFRAGTRWIITQGYHTSSHGDKTNCPIIVGGSVVSDESDGLNLYALDFAPAPGTTDQTVVAAADGTVWRRNDNIGAILLKHGDTGYYTTYLHMENIRVTPGQQVSQGTPLGTVGSVGPYSSGPHLHFSLVRRTSTTPYDAVTTFDAPFPRGLQDWEPVPLSFVEAQFDVQGEQCNQHKDTPVDVSAIPIAASATVLLLDVSGSMGNNWQEGVKIESAKAAAVDVIDMIEQESQVGASDHQVAIATFTTDAHLDLALTTDYNIARQVVNGLMPLNQTNIGAGLQISNQALTSAPTGAQKIIILLSDGLTNEGLSPQEILDGPVQEAASTGSCIYTVGFGDPGALDEELLRNIAAGAACGEYNYASAPDELERVYIRLRHQSLGQILGEFHGQIAQGEQVDAGQVDVPSGQGGLYASLYWPGSVLGLVLTDPQGQIVDENYPGAIISTYPRMVYAIVDDPLAGTWDIDVFGQDVPAGTTRFDAIISSRVALVTPVPTEMPTVTPTVAVVQPSGGIGPALVFLVVVVGAVALLVLNATRGRMQTATAGVPGVARPRLIARSGQLAGREFPLGAQGLTIGRGRGNDVHLEESSVSRQHAAIRFARGQFFLQDQGSTTGTSVNGQRVNATALNDGDQIRIGSTEFEFCVG